MLLLLWEEAVIDLGAAARMAFGAAPVVGQVIWNARVSAGQHAAAIWNVHVSANGTFREQEATWIARA